MKSMNDKSRKVITVFAAVLMTVISVFGVCIKTQAEETASEISVDAGSAYLQKLAENANSIFTAYYTDHALKSVAFYDVDRDGIPEMMYIYVISSDGNQVYKLGIQVWTVKNKRIVNAGKLEAYAVIGPAGYSFDLYGTADGYLCFKERFGDETFRYEFTYYKLGEDGTLSEAGSETTLSHSMDQWLLGSHATMDTTGYFAFDEYGLAYQGITLSEAEAYLGTLNVGTVIVQESSGSVETGDMRTTTGQTYLYLAKAYDQGAAISLRSAPGDNQPVIASIPAGAVFSIMSDNGNGWGQAVFNGTSGWVKLTNTIVEGECTVEAPAGGFIPPAYYVVHDTQGEGLERRSRPTADSATFGPLYDGTAVCVEAIDDNGWCYVEYEGKHYYMHSAYLRFVSNK